MAYPAVHCFRGSSVSLKQTNKPKMLQCDQTAALITDFVVATLFVTVGILALIQMAGLADLGALSGLGSIGPTAAYAMILTGVAIVAVDLVTLMIQQAPEPINRSKRRGS